MSAFLGKNRSFTQRISRSCSSVSSFCKIKGYESKSFTDHPSRIRLLDCPKLLEMTSKMTMTSRFVDVTSWSVFWFLKLLCRVSLVKFSQWSKFHVNIITGSGIIPNFKCFTKLQRAPKHTCLKKSFSTFFKFLIFLSW